MSTAFLKRNGFTHLPESQNIWNGEIVDEFREDVDGKRAKIDLMTLGSPKATAIALVPYGAVRSPRGMAELDEGAEEGFLALSRESPSRTENRD